LRFHCDGKKAKENWIDQHKNGWQQPRADVHSGASRDLSEAIGSKQAAVGRNTQRGVIPMRRKILGLIFALVATATLAAAQSTPTTQSAAPTRPATPPPAPHTTLKVGDPAPDFNLPSTAVDANSRTVRYKLSDFKGKKNVVLAFYVLAFTGG
jgi:hypothetical protein